MSKRPPNLRSSSAPRPPSPRQRSPHRPRRAPGRCRRSTSPSRTPRCRASLRAASCRCRCRSPTPDRPRRGVVAGGPYYCAQDSVLKATTECSCTGAPTLSCKVGEASTAVPSWSRPRAPSSRGPHRRPGADRPPARGDRGGREGCPGAGRDHPPAARLLRRLRPARGRAQAGDARRRRPHHAHHRLRRRLRHDRRALHRQLRLRGRARDPRLDLRPRRHPAAHHAHAGGPLRRVRPARLHPRDRLLQPSWGTGLDKTGWVYIPPACAAGERCRLHVVFHGCKQGRASCRCGGRPMAGCTTAPPSCATPATTAGPHQPPGGAVPAGGVDPVEEPQRFAGTGGATPTRTTPPATASRSAACAR